MATASVTALLGMIASTPPSLMAFGTGLTSCFAFGVGTYVFPTVYSIVERSASPSIASNSAPYSLTFWEALFPFLSVCFFLVLGSVVAELVVFLSLRPHAFRRVLSSETFCFATWLKIFLVSAVPNPCLDLGAIVALQQSSASSWISTCNNENTKKKKDPSGGKSVGLPPPPPTSLVVNALVLGKLCRMIAQLGVSWVLFGLQGSNGSSGASTHQLVQSLLLTVTSTGTGSKGKDAIEGSGKEFRLFHGQALITLTAVMALSSLFIYNRSRSHYTDEDLLANEGE